MRDIDIFIRTRILENAKNLYKMSTSRGFCLNAYQTGETYIAGVRN